MLLLEKEVKDLRAANKKQIQKRSLPKRQIVRAKGISISEAYKQGIGLLGGIEGGGVSSAAPTQTASVTGVGTNRRQYKCSVCGTPGHRANRCPDRV